MNILTVTENLCKNIAKQYEKEREEKVFAILNNFKPEKADDLDSEEDWQREQQHDWDRDRAASMKMWR